MSAPSKAGGKTIENKRQLVEYFESACKPASEWRLGTEHEKFVFRLEDLRPIPYEGERGINAFLGELMRFGWESIEEDGKRIALGSGGCNITLEPGGQLELAGEPLENVHQVCNEVHTHLHQVKTVAAEMDLGLIGLGFNPKWKREDIPWMPKQRYQIMRNYMPKVGTLGLDMMLRTTTVQVNIDYGSEADMVKKFRVGLALQPIATALFANSPFTEGKPNGFLSYRSQIWTDTDNNRAGMLPFVFESGMGFERYVDYALDVPSLSFRDFLKGELKILPGELPTLGDWDAHLTTIFPEVRLKKFMEMRGADGGPWRRLCAFPALWAGLCYDASALDAAWELVADWSEQERDALRAAVPRSGLETQLRGHKLQHYARDVVAIAQEGLAKRAYRDSAGEDERQFVERLAEIAETGRTPAQELLEHYQGSWNESVDPVFSEYAY